MIDYGILFIIGTFILLGIYLLYPTIYKVKEPFVVNPVAEESAVGKVEGVDSTSQLPTAPYGQVASNAPSSYRVYSVQPAPRNRILELLEDLKAFLTFEGPNLQDKSDPQIQLPLSTARGDLKTLESQAEVIKRNPGIRSTITDENLREIFSNLEFLRQQARNVFGRELYTGKYTEKIKDVAEFESIEGFSGACASYPSVDLKNQHEGFTIGGRGLSAQENLLVDTLQKNYGTYFQNKPKATKQELNNHIINIISYLNTIRDCSVSKGTTGLVISGCAKGLSGENYGNTLDKYKRTVKYEIILMNLVTAGKLDEAQIPVSREATTKSKPLDIFDIPTLPTFTPTSYTETIYSPSGGAPEDNLTGSTHWDYDNLRAFLEDLSETTTTSTTGSSSRGSSSTGSSTTTTGGSTSTSSSTTSTTSTTSATPTPSPTPSSSNNATLSDVLEAYARAMAEKTRLQALNTTDPETATRINNINAILTYLNDIISKVNSGSMKEADIPVTKSQLDIFIKGGEKPDEVSILDNLGLSSALSNLFSGDSDTNKKLADKYTNKFLKGFSWNVDVGLKYTSDNEAMAGFNRNFSKCDDENKNGLTVTGFPSMDELNNIINDDYKNNTLTSTPTDPYANDPRNEGRPVSGFDWKERAKFIESAIKKRGLKTSDFGVMPDGAEVSDDFNWKGYAKMICMRLGASYDTGLPEACGCPPMFWSGWR